MRRYKIVACIPLILSVFSFVLAAPIAVREVREACTDAVDGGNNMTIELGKRGEVQPVGETEPLLGKKLEPSSSSNSWLTSSQHQESSSAPTYASGADPSPSADKGKSISPGTGVQPEEVNKPLLGQKQGPSSSSSSWLTPSQHQESYSTPAYASGADPNPSFSSADKGKSISPGTSIEMQPLKSIGTQTAGTSAKINPGPPSLSKSVSFAPLRGVSLPTGEVYREFEPSDSEAEKRPPLPPSPGPEREKNLLQLQIANLKKPPKSQSSAKKLWKTVFSSMRKTKFWRRISGAPDDIFD